MLPLCLFLLFALQCFLELSHFILVRPVDASECFILVLHDALSLPSIISKWVTYLDEGVFFRRESWHHLARAFSHFVVTIHFYILLILILMTDLAAAVEEPTDLLLLSLKEKVYIKCRHGRELRGKLVVSVYMR